MLTALSVLVWQTHKAPGTDAYQGEMKMNLLLDTTEATLTLADDFPLKVFSKFREVAVRAWSWAAFWTDSQA